MSAVHICQWCEGRYPCETFVEGEDEHGHVRSACDCKVKDECAGCSEHGACEDCGQAPAGDERSMFRCTPCADVWMDNYEPPEPDLNDGGSAPSGLAELQASADRLNREGRY